MMLSLRRDTETPKEVSNWRLWYGVLVFGMLGAARGLDEGLTGTTASQPSFANRFGLNDGGESSSAGKLGNITSMVQLGSIPGALLAFFIADKVGRLWALRELCFIWAVGIAIYLSASANGSIGTIYAGRFIAGLGVGQTTVVAPTYLAEIAPRYARGLCVCVFAGSAYLGIMLGYFAIWGASLHIDNNSQMEWVVPNLLPIYFAVIIFALSFAATESPRWLAKVGKPDRAVQNLSKIRHLPEDHWYVQAEFSAIRGQLQREQEESKGLLASFKELVTSPANRYRIMLSVMAQLLGQWSGANSIVVYAPQFFAILGTTGNNEKLLATAITGVVDFVAAVLCAVFIVDLLGRKRALMSGICLQFIALLYVAIFLTVDPGLADKSNAVSQTSSQKSAGTGAIVMIYIAGIGWALGWNSLQYLISAEIYPLQLRALGASIGMTVHFANQFGNSKAVSDFQGTI